MKVIRFSLVFCLALAFGISFLCGVNTAQAKAIELSYANFFPPTHIQAKLGDSWAKEIEKRTNGKVKITYYPGGALLKEPKSTMGFAKASQISGCLYSLIAGVCSPPWKQWISPWVILMVWGLL